MRTARSGGNLLLLVEDLAQQASVHPLHDHVDLAAIVIGEDLHHAGMIQGLADLFLALKAIKQDRIALHLGMRNLDGDLPAVAQIGAAKDGGHAAAGDKALNAVVIELIAGMERGSFG